MYVLGQHMAAPCCRGSLSPGLASPALGQMVARWALKSERAAGDPGPGAPLLTLALPVCLVASAPAAPPHAPELLRVPADADLIGFPPELNGKANSVNKMWQLSQFYHSPAAAELLQIIQGSGVVLMFVLKSRRVLVYLGGVCYTVTQ